MFKKDGVFFRQINTAYRQNYDLLMSSGLYKTLTESGALIGHQNVSMAGASPDAYKIIKPDQLAFISYPYEWCFGQLRDAALLTLTIQKTAMQHGMSLKDASAFNIQFVNGRPLLIDTLSFEQYHEGKPWVAYRQFCQHFLAPLALEALVDLRFGGMTKLFIDGIPLDLTAGLLPLKTKFSPGLAAHIHLHARSQKRHADTSTGQKQTNYHLPENRLLSILESLTATITSLHLPRQATEWGDYYDHTNYSDAAFNHKKEIISKWMTEIKPASVWDAGANDASFSRLASQQKIPTVATDIDPIAIEKAYRRMKEEKDTHLLPLILDITNPTPAIGWANNERMSFFSRGTFDLGLCLAFIHHLAIANNLPFDLIARLFATQCRHLIIEFVPKDDSNAQRLLSSREDIFSDYNQAAFEKEFSKYFTITEQIAIRGSSRILYIMHTRTS